MKKKKELKTCQNIFAIFRANSINSRFFVFICKDYKIRSRSILILCAIIAVFSIDIFKILIWE